MSVIRVKIGSKCPNKPESVAEVVEATTIDLSWATACPGKETAIPRTAIKTSIDFRIETMSAQLPI
jgi:hypothetical protein